MARLYAVYSFTVRNGLQPGLGRTVLNWNNRGSQDNRLSWAEIKQLEKHILETCLEDDENTTSVMLLKWEWLRED